MAAWTARHGDRPIGALIRDLMFPTPLVDRRTADAGAANPLCGAGHGGTHGEGTHAGSRRSRHGMTTEGR